MARPPNYNQERRDRDRAKAAKKAEKLAAKQEGRKSRTEADAGESPAPHEAEESE